MRPEFGAKPNPKEFSKPGAAVEDRKPEFKSTGPPPMIGEGVENPKELSPISGAAVENPKALPPRIGAADEKSATGATVDDSIGLMPKEAAELISTPSGEGVEYPAELISTFGAGVVPLISTMGAGVVN